MRVYKYETKDLVCYKEQDGHRIYDKADMKLVAVYVNRDLIKLSPVIPVPETNYKYFNQMSEIVDTIITLEGR